MFHKNSVSLAQELIGYRITKSKTSGIIVETEAYPGEKDPACHYDGKSTKRGKIFEKGPGTVYVFSMHGHNCLNLICGSESYPEAVLLRALEPVTGLDKMKARRGRKRSLTDGPGKLTEALKIGKEDLNGSDFRMTDLELTEERSNDVVADTRIGITSAEDWPLRFCQSDSEHLSATVERITDPQDVHRYLNEEVRDRTA